MAFATKALTGILEMQALRATIHANGMGIWMLHTKQERLLQLMIAHLLINFGQLTKR